MKQGVPPLVVVGVVANVVRDQLLAAAVSNRHAVLQKVDELQRVTL